MLALLLALFVSLFFVLCMVVCCFLGLIIDYGGFGYGFDLYVVWWFTLVCCLDSLYLRCVIPLGGALRLCYYCCLLLFWLFYLLLICIC